MFPPYPAKVSRLSSSPRRSAALLMIFMLICFPRMLMAEQSGDFVYGNDGGFATIWGYTGSAVHMNIPGTVDGLPVRAIAAINNTAIESVVIPGGVTSIGGRVFFGCASLTRITIPDGVTSIGREAFTNCVSLKSVVIPDSVTSLGADAFTGCVSLTSADLPAGIVSIEPGTFRDCYSLARAIIPRGVTSIGPHAFSGCRSLAALSLPDTMTRIGSEAFTGCVSLENVIIPGSVTSMEARAFSACGLTSVTVPGNSGALADFTFQNCSRLTSVILAEGVTSIGAGAFSGCAALSGIVIPGTVTSLGAGAFMNCARLDGAVIPPGVTAIQQNTFYGCAGLTGIMIHEGVTFIGESAFSYCSGLTSITVPASVTSMDHGAFSDCVGIASVIISEGATLIGRGAFANCPALTGVSIPGTVVSIGDSAFEGCRALASIVIPQGVVSIGAGVFKECSALTGVSIPGSVVSIGDRAFESCSGLAGITLAHGLKSIGKSAFMYCVALNGVSIPGSVTSLGNDVFSGCSSLTGMIIPGSVTLMGTGAFNRCQALRSVTLPDSLTIIGFQSFHGCTALTGITIPPGVTTIDYGAFSYCVSLTSVTIPDSVTAIMDLAFAECAGLESVILPGKLTSIGKNAFQNCVSLTGIMIPDSVTTIAAGAFSGCSRLATVTIPRSVTSIGDYAFAGCGRLAHAVLTGWAPVLGIGVFNAAAPNFSIIAAPGARFLTFPTWQGYPSVRLVNSEAPFAVLVDNVVRESGVPEDTGMELTGVVVTRRLCIVNTRGVPQSFQVSLLDANSPAFSLDTSLMPGTLAARAAAVLTLSFTPSEPGPVSAVVEITGSSTENGKWRLPVTGSGVTPLRFTQSAYLKAAIPGQRHSFGAQVAVSGDTMAVAAPRENGTGAVYIFVKSGTGWRQEARLTASNAGRDDLFGSAVALEGGTLAVGASAEDSSATGINGNQADNNSFNTGAVYLFTRSGTAWSQQAYIKGSRSRFNDSFGKAVSLSGDILAVGAPGDSGSIAGSGGGGQSSGAVYLLTRADGAWRETVRLKASNAGSNDGFGGAVSLSGGTLVAGAAAEDSSATGVNGDGASNAAPGSGAAYVFVKTGDEWRQEAFLKASNTGAGDQFGQSVGISGDTVIVGAPGEDSGAVKVNGDQTDNSASDSGAAYIFVRTASVWHQQAYLKSEGTGYLGMSVCVSDGTALVGNYLESSVPAYYGSGSVRLFQRTGPEWVRQIPLTASNAEYGDAFGGSFAISGTRIVVGAPGENSAAGGVDGNSSNNSAFGAGAAYCFEAGLAPEAPVLTLGSETVLTVSPGTSATLNAAASGIPAPQFQWYYGGSGDTSNPVSGGNWKILLTPPLTSSGKFWVRAFNSQGSADSATVSVVILSVSSSIEEWRAAYFGSPDNGGDAADAGDPDQDGQSNLEEFIAGTAPISSSDAFRILACGPGPGKSFQVTVPGKAGRVYHLLRTPDPSSAAWESVDVGKDAPADGPLELIDPAPLGIRAFYRVAVSRP